MQGRVAIVTGASRGIGKGIAAQLAKAGATVYITGRTMSATASAPGTLPNTAEEINRAAEAAGGRCVPVQCDHGNDWEVEALFESVLQEHGRLDVLVNNAYGAVNTIMDTAGKKFWMKDVSVWDDSNNVGLRSHYVASVFAARIMVPYKSGLIVNISSYGGWKYAGFATDVAYGVGKAALDRLANDMAVELRKFGVAAVSLWPGAVATELLGQQMEKNGAGDTFRQMAETPEFAGAAIVALYKDANLMEKTGKVLLTTELAEELGFTDLDGKIPQSHPANLRKSLSSRVPTHWDLAAKL